MTPEETIVEMKKLAMGDMIRLRHCNGYCTTALFTGFVSGYDYRRFNCTCVRTNHPDQWGNGSPLVFNIGEFSRKLEVPKDTVLATEKLMTLRKELKELRKKELTLREEIAMLECVLPL